VVNPSGELALDSPAVHDALRFLQKITLERRAYLPENVSTSRWWDLVRFLAQNMVPMALGGTYELPRMRDEAEWMETESEVAEHLGFVLMPRPSLDIPALGSLGGTSWAILQQSPVQELSMEILKLVGSTEISGAFCEENLQISPRCSINKHFINGTHPWLSTVVPLLSMTRTRPLVHNYVQVSRFLQQMFEQVLWQGAPVEDAVQRTTQSLDLLLEKV
jgi:ABC-type glycerol-3-phosphate transport system substrate-binding protein